MAAHIKTALEQLKEGKFIVDSVRSALALSCWTEELDFDDYLGFSQLVHGGPERVPPVVYVRDAVMGFAFALYPKYRERWYNLGCPKTREQWLGQQRSAIDSLAHWQGEQAHH